jgi:hypothetical protein
MNHRHKGVQDFLIVVVSLLILIFPAYLRCNQLSQIKLVSSDIGFEILFKKMGYLMTRRN